MNIQIKKRIRIIMILIIIMWMLVIFRFSMDTSVESHTLSDMCVQVFNRLVYRLTGKDLTIVISPSHYLWIELCFRKLAHMFIYFILSISIMIFLFTFQLNMLKRMSISLVFCFLYALSDEFHQLFVAGRGASLFDAFIDTSGAFLGILCALILYCIAYTLFYKNKNKIS